MSRDFSLITGIPTFAVNYSADHKQTSEQSIYSLILTAIHPQKSRHTHSVQPQNSAYLL